MKRWFYILLGGLGMSLAAGAVVAMMWLKPVAEVNAARAMIVEIMLIAMGTALGVLGFIKGRAAGELDITSYMKAPRRNHKVAGREIGFACPVCQKRYRASPLLAGTGFTCRDCKQVFEVPRVSQSPRPMERRLLPAPL